MIHTYTIKSIDENEPTIMIHPQTADYLGIDRKKIVFLSFGTLRSFANLSKSNEVPLEEIRLSSKVISDLHLPVYLEFEIRVNYNEVIMGPFIGLLMSKENKKLTTGRLERMKRYVRDYEEIYGAVVIFALDKVDVAGKLIDGYCYNPVSKSFEIGVFPFPSSIYRTIGLNNQWKNYFLSALGDRVFNNHYFNKWDMYKWFCDNTNISNRIPFSIVYQTPRDIFDSLSKFKKIYAKPVSGLRGKGIIRIEQHQEKYVIESREKGVNQKDVFENREKAAEYFKYKFRPGRYLVQQAVDLIQYAGGTADFRCVMQKDPSGTWVCKAIIGRYGKPGSIVSNISSGGKAIKIDEMVISSDPASAIVKVGLKTKINSFALQICNALDEYGLNCGTLGLDIGVDIGDNLWLIEINNRDPDSSIALDVHDMQLYRELKSGPLLYAKFLAGFGRRSDND